MMAAVMRGPRSVSVEKVEDPVVPSGWALVRSRTVGICGTDKAFYRGTYRLFKEPLIPGHEVSGEVVEGPEDLIGARVVSEINFSCLKCAVCRAGMYTHCPYRRTLGIDFDGGMAEYFVAPSWALHTHDMSHDVAFAAEPLAAVLNALEKAPPKPGWSVAVVGTGFIAWLAAQVFRLTGFEPVVVTRRGSSKARLFESEGFEVATFEEALERGRRTWSGLGFDMVFEATGSNEGVRAAVALARPRGVVHLKSTPGGEAPLPQTEAVVKELTLVGSRCGDHRNFGEALRMLSEGLVKVVVSASFTLAEAREAFIKSMEPGVVKVIVKP